MHGMHGRASVRRVRTTGWASGPSLRCDGPEELRTIVCAEASGHRARRLRPGWDGGGALDCREAARLGGHLLDPSWASYVESDEPAAASKATLPAARWAPPGAIAVEAAAAFGGRLVPGTPLRLLAALDESATHDAGDPA